MKYVALDSLPLRPTIVKKLSCNQCQAGSGWNAKISHCQNLQNPNTMFLSLHPEVLFSDPNSNFIAYPNSDSILNSIKPFIITQGPTLLTNHTFKVNLEN